MSDPTQNLARLRDAGPTLPRDLRTTILAKGSSHLAGLIGTLDSDDWSYEGEGSDGWGPIHAVDLLTELSAPEAIEPMLRAYARTEPEEILHERIIVRLPRFGAAALEPVLAALGDGRDLGLCEALAKLGIRDDRVFAKFQSVFEEDAEAGAMLFGSYGDDRALPLLRAALENLEPDLDNPFGPRELIELDAAYRDLGGVLSPELQARVDGWFAEAEARRSASAAAPPTGGFVRSAPKVGRNDLCPCGSGRKYKKCCITSS